MEIYWGLLRNIWWIYDGKVCSHSHSWRLWMFILLTIFWIAKSWLVGGLNPSEKYSQLGWFFPIYGKINHVPKHQPDGVCFLNSPSETNHSTHIHQALLGACKLITRCELFISKEGFQHPQTPWQVDRLETSPKFLATPGLNIQKPITNLHLFHMISSA